MATITEIEILVATPGITSDTAIESRATSPDDSDLTFAVTNISKGMKYTNVKLYLFFDFTGKNLTVNGHIRGGPLVVELGKDMLPFVPYTVTLQLVANAGTRPSVPAVTPPATYSIITSATFDSEPLLPEAGATAPIAGGIQMFSVVEG